MLISTIHFILAIVAGTVAAATIEAILEIATKTAQKAVTSLVEDFVPREGLRSSSVLSRKSIFSILWWKRHRIRSILIPTPVGKLRLEWRKGVTPPKEGDFSGPLFRWAALVSDIVFEAIDDASINVLAALITTAIVAVVSVLLLQGTEGISLLGAILPLQGLGKLLHKAQEVAGQPIGSSEMTD